MCGLVGIVGKSDIAPDIYDALTVLQHRGQEAAGIVSWDGEMFHAHRGLGHVDENFGAQSNGVIETLLGHVAIGHTRYSTTGKPHIRNVQPMFADFDIGSLAVCHNGNLTNALALRSELVGEGRLLQSTSDTETVIHLIARSRGATVVDRVIETLHQIEGAYSFAFLTRDMLIGVRDPYGVRPLVLGRLGEAWILASETCALDILGATFERE